MTYPNLLTLSLSDSKRARSANGCLFFVPSGVTLEGKEQSFDKLRTGGF